MKLYKHQKDCLKKHGRKEAFALLAEMGTGKTCIIIHNIADLYRIDACDSVLVLAPNGVHTNWTRLEIPKHMPKDIPLMTRAWRAGMGKKEAREFSDIYDDSFKGVRILTANHEALSASRSMLAIERFCETTNKLMIVVDESDGFKNPTAKRTKNLFKLKPYSATRRILTGTPINNSPFDAFSQFNFLHHKILNCKSFFAFKNEYGELLHRGHPLYDSIRARSRGNPQIVARDKDGLPKYKNLDQLTKLIEPYSYRVLKKDCLDLPKKIYKTLLFDMTPVQTDIYEKAEKECRLVFEETETPFDRLVALQKLAQITSGYYIHPASEEPVRIEGKNPKLDLLIERVKAIVESGNKVIIWARYRIEIEDIVSRLNAATLHNVQYHGGVKSCDREKAIDSFMNGDAMVFVGNQQAGGRGITLTSASYVIYFSNNFSLRDRLQSEDRAHRIGQEHNVTYINIAAQGTIDEYVIGALENKKDIADTIIKEFK